MAQLSEDDVKVNPNDIEFITNGERASSINLNRALKQFITKNNDVLETIRVIINEHDQSLSTGSLTPLEKINNDGTNISSVHLGAYVVRGNNISVQNGLPVGWKCHVLATANIQINLGLESVFGTGNTTFTLAKDKTIEIVKVTTTRWSVINR